MTAHALELEHLIREHLSELLSSSALSHVERIKRFLRYIVEETLAGRYENLNEYRIGVEVFDRDTSFDPRKDPIVRVHARRLRFRLRCYYEEEGRNGQIQIELPEDSYTPGVRRRAAKGLASRSTVNVLPFADHSPNEDHAYFCDGIRDEIINALVRLGQVRVVLAPTGAATIIGGSVRVSSSELRVTVHAIDAGSGTYLWSETFDRAEGEDFVIQDEVARTVLEKVKTNLIGFPRERQSRQSTSYSAYDLYLQGRYHCSEFTATRLREAIDFFENAIGEDPQYAPAYAGLADAYSLLSMCAEFAPVDISTKAASNAAWAVRLDDDLAESHTSLARIKATQDWDWHGAAYEYQRAISLDPRSTTAHHWYAVTSLVQLGRMDDALHEMLLAHSLDPVSTMIACDTARVLFYRREFEAAIEQCDRTIERYPDFDRAYWILGLIQEQVGKFDEAAAAFQRGIQLVPDRVSLWGALGRLYAVCGKDADATRVARQIEASAGQGYISPFEPAMIHFALGDLDCGFNWLLKAKEERCHELIWLNVDPRFDKLRSDPRFRAIVNQVGLL
jgi:TolB-like protein/Tfp pilus assembly protein PilF